MTGTCGILIDIEIESGQGKWIGFGQGILKGIGSQKDLVTEAEKEKVETEVEVGNGRERKAETWRGEGVERGREAQEGVGTEVKNEAGVERESD